MAQTKIQSPVEIRQVNNGFIVYPARDFTMREVATEAEYIHVFERFDQMVIWLGRHFLPLVDDGSGGGSISVTGVSHAA
jgi:hypothetical protein